MAILAFVTHRGIGISKDLDTDAGLGIRKSGSWYTVY